MKKHLFCLTGLLICLLLIQNHSFAEDGWEYIEVEGNSFLVKVSDADDVKCSICLDILINPVRDCDNEDAFCRECYDQLPEPKRNCPLCMTSFRGSPQPCIKLNQKINKLKAKCNTCNWQGDYYDISCHIEKGCSWSCDNEQCKEIFSTIDQLEEHKAICPHRMVQIEVPAQLVIDLEALFQSDSVPNVLQTSIKELLACKRTQPSPFKTTPITPASPPKKQHLHCVNNCGFSGSSADMTTHLSRCLNKLDACQYDCALKILRKDMAEHLKSCPHRPVVCELCYQQIPYSQQLEHKNTACLNAMISCPNEQKGCITQIKRAEANCHLTRCEYENVRCKLCNVTIQRRLQKDHKNNDCSKFEIPCEYCQEIYERCDMSFHIKRQCHKAPVECTFKESGCNEKVARDSLATHKEECQYRSYPCPHHCGLTVVHHDLEKHLTQCEELPSTLIVRSKHLQQFKGNIYKDQVDADKFYWVIRKNLLKSLAEKNIASLCTSAFPLKGRHTMALKLSQVLRLSLYPEPWKTIECPVSYLDIETDMYPDSSAIRKSCSSYFINMPNDKFHSHYAAIVDKNKELKKELTKLSGQRGEYIIIAIRPTT